MRYCWGDKYAGGMARLVQRLLVMKTTATKALEIASRYPDESAPKRSPISVRRGTEALGLAKEHFAAENYALALKWALLSLRDLAGEYHSDTKYVTELYERN